MAMHNRLAWLTPSLAQDHLHPEHLALARACVARVPATLRHYLPDMAHDLGPTLEQAFTPLGSGVRGRLEQALAPAEPGLRALLANANGHPDEPATWEARCALGYLYKEALLFEHGRLAGHPVALRRVLLTSWNDAARDTRQKILLHGVVDAIIRREYMPLDNLCGRFPVFFREAYDPLVMLSVMNRWFYTTVCRAATRERGRREQQRVAAEASALEHTWAEHVLGPDWLARHRILDSIGRCRDGQTMGHRQALAHLRAALARHSPLAEDRLHAWLESLPGESFTPAGNLAALLPSAGNDDGR